jgi:hypothetical protein
VVGLEEEVVLDYDTILASVQILNSDEVRMIAGWTYRDAGMDPIRVVMYDVIREGRETTRRLVVVQGNRGMTDLIIDYMEGW